MGYRDDERGRVMWFQSWSFFLAWGIIILGSLAVIAWAYADRRREQREEHRRWLDARRREVIAHREWQRSLGR